MDNDDAIMAGEDDLARADELALPGEDVETDGLEPDSEDGEPDLIEIEMDGQVFEVPAGLKGAFLRHADYTRKTQELAEHRRAVEAERQSVAEERRAARAGLSHRAHIAGLDEQLEAFAGVDWQAAAASDPQRAQALWRQREEMQALRDQYAYALSHHDAQSQLQAQREASERMAQTGAKLRQEIEGWSPETAAKLVEYAEAFGVTPEELSQVADARLWKLLHKAYQADEPARGEATSRAQSVRPAVTVGGAAAGSGGVRDELAVKDWMARRNDQMLKGR